MYRYHIKSTNDSSAKFGPCEVCNKHVTEVFYQVEEKAMSHREGWMHQGGLFGHQQCLLNQRQA